MRKHNEVEAESIMIWSQKETMLREDIESIQLERLKETIERMYEKN